MRICMVSYSFYESDTRLLQYTSALLQRGDSIDVFALRRTGQPKFEVWKGVNLYRIQERTVNECGPFSYLIRILRFLIHSTILLTRKHISKRYQLIHIHAVPDFLVFAAFIPRLLGTPVILDIHDILPEFYASKFHLDPGSVTFAFLLFVEKCSAAFSSHVIIANDLWHKRLVSRCVKLEKCTAIGNYPDQQIFYPRPKNRTNQRFQIIYPGTLNWHQGLDIAIKAFARISNRMQNAEFHIYGEGPTKAELIELTKNFKLTERIIFHDFLPIEEIVEVMAQSDLAVVPKRASSTFGNEAASTKILEFMSLEVPLVVSRTKVDSFYYRDSMVRFFESENDGDLADQILALWCDPAVRKSLTYNAKKFAKENSWDLKKHHYLTLVDSVAGNRAIGTSARETAINEDLCQERRDILGQQFEAGRKSEHL